MNYPLIPVRGLLLFSGIFRRLFPRELGAHFRGGRHDEVGNQNTNATQKHQEIVVHLILRDSALE